MDLELQNMTINTARKLLDEGSILLGSGNYSIRFRPHLNVTPEDIDKSIEIISAAVKEMLR